jgi:hypothetical protein
MFVARSGRTHLRKFASRRKARRTHRPLYRRSKFVVRRLPARLSPSTRERLPERMSPSARERAPRIEKLVTAAWQTHPKALAAGQARGQGSRVGKGLGGTLGGRLGAGRTDRFRPLWSLIPNTAKQRWRCGGLDGARLQLLASSRIASRNNTANAPPRGGLVGLAVSLPGPSPGRLDRVRGFPGERGQPPVPHPTMPFSGMPSEQATVSPVGRADTVAKWRTCGKTASCLGISTSPMSAFGLATKHGANPLSEPRGPGVVPAANGPQSGYGGTPSREVSTRASPGI